MIIPSVLLNPPPDDAGAETADRYDWQALVAAVDFLTTVAKASSGHLDMSCGAFVICEHHEDYILCIDGEIQLVSVKHRDLSQGNWTFAQVFKKGGIAHLYERWSALSEATQARLVTNAELGPGSESELRTLCKYLRNCQYGPLTLSQTELLISASTRILKVLSETIDVKAKEWTDDGESPSTLFENSVRRFLSKLIFDCGRPHRQILPTAAPSMYVTPFLQAIGHPVGVAAAVWEAVGTLFRRRMRGRGEHSTEALAAVAEKIFEHKLDGDETAIQVRKRTITMSDLSDLLEVANTGGISPVDRGFVLAPTRLAIKLINAGCQETTAHAAEAAASRWRNHEYSIRSSEVGAGAEVEKVKTQALVLASDVQEEFATAYPSTDYGPKMWRELRAKLSPEIFSGGSVVLDHDLALGIVCDLASQCQVWFSAKFDLEAARSAFPGRMTATAVAGGDN